MNYGLMKEALTGIGPTNEEISEAVTEAFDANFEGEWLENVSEQDRLALLSQIWSVCTDNKKSATEKYADIRHTMDIVATKCSDRWAAANWVKFLK